MRGSESGPTAARRRAVESRGGRRNPGMSLAATAIDVASVIQRLREGNELTEADRAAIARARETVLEVAAAARVDLVPGTHGRRRARGSVVQARLTLATLRRSWAAGSTKTPVPLQEQLTKLLAVLDDLAAGRLPERTPEVLQYFESLAEAALRANSSTGEVLVGGSRGPR